MAKKKKKKKSDKEKLDKVRKGERRKAMIEAGVYNVHKEKTMKDKSKYSRKDKHKKRPK